MNSICFGAIETRKSPVSAQVSQAGSPKSLIANSFADRVTFSSSAASPPSSSALQIFTGPPPGLKRPPWVSSSWQRKKPVQAVAKTAAAWWADQIRATKARMEAELGTDSPVVTAITEEKIKIFQDELERQIKEYLRTANVIHAPLSTRNGLLLPLLSEPLAVADLDPLFSLPGYTSMEIVDGGDIIVRCPDHSGDSLERAEEVIYRTPPKWRSHMMNQAVTKRPKLEGTPWISSDPRREEAVALVAITAAEWWTEQLRVRAERAEQLIPMPQLERFRDALAERIQDSLEGDNRPSGFSVKYRGEEQDSIIEESLNAAGLTQFPLQGVEAITMSIGFGGKIWVVDKPDVVGHVQQGEYVYELPEPLGQYMHDVPLAFATGGQPERRFSWLPW